MEWQPPDGGYGWVVAISAFLICFLSSHIFCTFCFYFTVLLEYYHTSATVISWISCLLLSVGSFLGVFIGVSVDMFGFQNPTILAGIFTVSLALVCSQLRYIYVLFICYGIFMSIASITMFHTANVSIHNYFTAKRSLASSFTVVGLSLGSLVWPPLTQYVISQYKWHGSMLIFSAVYLHFLPLGWLLRDTPITLAKRKETKGMNILQLAKRKFNFKLFSNYSFTIYIFATLFVEYGHMIPYIFYLYIVSYVVIAHSNLLG